jgi:tripartite-type tricarboxylate transporter receptor subunit TctC
MRLAAIVCAAAQFFIASALAQSYPAKPVTLIVPFAAGGTTDSAARLLAGQLEKIWNQKVLVEARPGAGQVVGTDYVVRSAPDGYTLLMAAPSVAVEQVLNKAVTFDLRRDVSPMAIAVGSGIVVAAPASIPVKNMSEWVAYAKANPGKVNWGTVGSLQPEFTEMIDRLGLKVTYVAYKGGMLAMQAVATGDVHIFGGSPLDALELSKAGRVRPLMYTGRSRHRLYSDLQTANEALGFNVDAGFWFGVFGPARVPQAIVAKVRKDVSDAARNPEVAKKYEALGLELYDETPEQMRAHIEGVIKTTESLLAKGLLQVR